MKQQPKKKTNRQNKTAARKSLSAEAKLPFLEHLYELKRRLTYIAISLFIWGAATYAVQEHIVNILLRPAKGQHFIYTSVGGGIDFLFRVCLYSGLIFSLPVIVYNSLRFIQPLISRGSRRFVVWGSLTSALLAVAGVAFGYRFGLPAALHFLLHQFTTVQIQPLITIQSYLAFVIVYMVGSAMLFQLPLLLLLINRITPLKPRRLFHYERWVILAAFVLAGLMNPTPNILSQLLVAGPFILMYQVGIGLVALTNRRKQRVLARKAEREAMGTAFKKRHIEPVSQLQTEVPAVIEQPQAAPRVPVVAAMTPKPIDPMVVRRPKSAVDPAIAMAPARMSVPAPLRVSPDGRPRKYLDGFIGMTPRASQSYSETA